MRFERFVRFVHLTCSFGGSFGRFVIFTLSCVLAFFSLKIFMLNFHNNVSIHGRFSSSIILSYIHLPTLMAC